MGEFDLNQSDGRAHQRHARRGFLTGPGAHRQGNGTPQHALDRVRAFSGSEPGLPLLAKAAMPSFWSAVANSDGRSCRSKFHPFGQRRLIGAVNRCSKRGHGGLRQLGNLCRQLDRLGHDARPPAPPGRPGSRARLRRIHHAAGQDQCPWPWTCRSRISRCGRPAPGMTPRLISGWPNRADIGQRKSIAHHRQLAAATQRQARDRGDDGFCT